MIKHLFKVSGLDAQGKPFMGNCVASDIIDAINMFREKYYSPHEIEQSVQMPADHPCCIVCLQRELSTDKFTQELVDTVPITDKDRFCLLLKECEIEFDVLNDGIELDACTLGGDGYLFIKFYEDGKFQEFVHYLD